jgi:hypothetical protein
MYSLRWNQALSVRNFWVKETAMFFLQKISYRNVFSHKHHLPLLEPMSFYMAANILVSLCAVVVELIMSGMCELNVLIRHQFGQAFFS